MASLTQALALRRASERKATTASRPIFIQGLARDRVDAALGKRQPPDGDPTADMRARLSWRWGAASWLGRVKWLEPEPDSNPRNSEPD